MSDELDLHETYSRDDVAKAFGEGHGQGGKWMSGVVPVGENDLALFVTLDKSSYSGQHRYEDVFISNQKLRWKSQKRASPENAWGQKHIEGGPEGRPHHLFVRTEKGEDFIYCGQVRYENHEGSKPMTIWWELLSPIPSDILEDFEEATDHAGGREEPDYIKSKELDLDPVAEGLRAVPDQDIEEMDKSPLEWNDPAWGWAGKLYDFLTQDVEEIVDSLKNHHKRRFEDLPMGSQQIEVWKKTVELFQEWMEPLSNEEGGEDILVVFEYELPGEGGRRPDVILITPSNHVIVIECKDKTASGISDLDQALRYKQDLAEYHSETDPDRVSAYLALLEDGARHPKASEKHSVKVITPNPKDIESLRDTVMRSLNRGQKYQPEQWLLGDYSPLPHLMDAVINTFEDNPLPRLKSVRSSNIPEAVDTIEELAQNAKEKNEHVLVLITGVPGSGKTLVGLQSSIRAQKAGINSLFLSGNGPLVAVLQDALDRAGAKGAAKGLVRPMYKFKQGVTANQNSTPAEMYIFDEGQRAWGSDRNNKYDGSEIELLKEVSSRKDWGIVVGLIGEGQRIYKDESGSLTDWIKDFQDESEDNPWRIVVPDRDLGLNEESNIERLNCLHLDVDIRAKSANRLHSWVDAVIEGRENDAANLAFELQKSGFPLHITSSREVAEDYVENLYENSVDPRYGWVISSAHRKGSDPEGMKAPFVNTHEVKDIWGPWYNAPPEDPASCCQLEKPCPEFGCQGLELDFSLVFWGDDLNRRNDGWEVRGNARKWSDEPEQHTLNAYRVLLTRGREGMVIRCRDEETRDYLRDCGATYLDEK